MLEPELSFFGCTFAPLPLSNNSDHIKQDHSTTIGELLTFA
jgi:hypothetical protein